MALTFVCCNIKYLLGQICCCNIEEFCYRKSETERQYY